VEKILSIDLPRPRDARNDRFFKQVDLLTEDIRKIS
jgi:hypothetical protein